MQLFRAVGGVLLATGRVAAEGHAACETLTCDAGATEFCATTPRAAPLLPLLRHCARGQLALLLCGVVDVALRWA